MENISLKDKAPQLSIAIISAAALSYEILLTRLFSIIQYHHFAYMIISLALLGYGISGTVLTLFNKPFSENFIRVYLASIILFAISMILCFLIAQQIPFNAEEVLWDWRQPLWLFVIYLLFMLPFLFAAIAIGLALMCFGRQISRLYAADLLGAGTGSVLIIVLLFVVMPDRVLPFLVAIAISAVLVAGWELQIRFSRWQWGLVILVILPFLIPSQWLALNISPYKGLPQLLKIESTRIVDSRSSPLGLLQVVESPVIPLRFAPGLSLKNDIEPPAQLAVFTDAGGMTVINQKTASPEQLSFLDQQTSAAVYHLRKAESVLVLGAGTGNDVLQASYHQVPKIDAVELNYQLADLLVNKYADFSGDIYHQPGITLHIDEARGFINRTRDKFDVIQIALLDSYSASTAGLYALSENYIYTKEAIQEYLSRLTSEGYLSITRWIKLPPRDALKLVSTVIEALRDLDENNPEQRIMLIRHWQTSTLLVKNSVISAEEIDRLRKFSTERLFDTAYYPGIDESTVNRFNILRQADYYQATRKLLGHSSEQFVEQYKFDIRPATDNQPYFFNFFKWAVLPDILDLKDRGGMPLAEWGYMVLVATLVQAVIASLVLILLPLMFRRSASIKMTRPAVFSLLYFLALGLGFLFIEIAFMQKFILFLHHPVYAIAVTLASFLVFAGAGSHYSKKLVAARGVVAGLKIVIVAIVVIGTIYSLLLDVILPSFISLPVMVKVLVTAVLIAPLAFAMGMPFPTVLGYLHDKDTKLIPWVWGVNGCASVISAVLAMLMAIHAGFVFVVAVALVLYILAATVFVQLDKSFQRAV
jgi:spermidine synthase